MFETLVVAVDPKGDGDRALPIVRALALRAPVDVDLVTVEPPGTPTAEADELEHHALLRGWTCDSWTIVRDPDPARGIVATTARRAAPILVMATSAKRPFRTSGFGNVARDVLRCSPVPVLLIGPRVPDDHAPVSNELVLAVDRDATAATARTVVSWQATFGGPPPLLVEVLGPFDDDRAPRRRLREVARELAAHEIRATTHLVVADDPVAGLEDIGATLGDPLFVVPRLGSADHRLRWQRTIQRLVAGSPHPVLVVPADPRCAGPATARPASQQRRSNPACRPR